jgi:hypothetical protein
MGVPGSYLCCRTGPTTWSPSLSSQHLSQNPTQEQD